MPHFTYRPLDSARHEIRLIRLPPGSFDDSINVEIFSAQLSGDHQPKYEALSYVWGSTERPDTILASHGLPLGEQARKSRKSRFTGAMTRAFRHRLFSLSKNNNSLCGELSITQNLSIALRHLRRSDKPRVLWIDAISINQDDITERGAEVGRMGEIFSRADSTIVWLGPASEASTFAIETLCSIGRDVSYSAERHVVTTLTGSKTAKIEDDSEAMIAKEPEWKAIQQLLYRQWFTRLWIYQEIRFSKHAIVVVGFSEMPWSMFRAAVYWMGSHLPPIPRLSTIFDLDYFHTRMNGIFEVSNTNDTGRIPLIKCIEMTNSAFCSDPKDRIYGVINIHTPKTLTIIPDYTKTKEDVYEDFTKKFITSVRDLMVLILCELQNPSPTLPSWVPDLSVLRSTMAIYAYNTCGRSQYTSHFSPSGKALHVKGVTVDTISHLGKAVPSRATLSEILAICCDWQPSNISGREYIGGGTMLDAYVKTLICGENGEDQRKSSGVRPTLEKCRKSYLSLYRNRQVDSATITYADWMRRVLRGRAFGTTSENYLGMFPAGAQIGDQICVVLGSDVPLLLRPVPDSENHYRLIGRCYIAGFMNDEALFGSLPNLWEFGSVDKLGNRIYIYNGNSATLEDPRLGPLPPGWRICHEEDETDEGDLDDFWYENEDSGESTFFDPRLTPEALIERGVNIQEFILV